MQRRKIEKKDLEKHLLERFISNIKLGLRVKSIEVGYEPPDFIIHELEKEISVEITRLIHPQLIEREAFQEKIVEEARVLFKEKHSVNLRVLVEFSNRPLKCKGSELRVFANTLSSIVEVAYRSNKDFEFRLSSRRVRKPLNEFIETISISNEENFENWQPFGAFLVPGIDTGWLQKIIRQKGENVQNYGPQFQENWLLLVSNFGHESSTHGFDFIEREIFQS